MSKGVEELLRGFGRNFEEAAGNFEPKPTPHLVAVPAKQPKPTTVSDQAFIPITQIVVHKQCRSTFPKAELEELAANIKAVGVLQPVLVRPRADKKFDLVAGERRFRAVKLLGLKEIPAFIRAMTDDECLELQLTENVLREDLRPLEQAYAFDKLMKQTNRSARELAQRLGFNETTITRSVRLLKLDKPIQQRVDSGELSPRHAREIARIDDHKAQRTLLAAIQRDNLSGDQTEQLVKDLLGEKRKPTKKPKRKARGAPPQLTFAQPEAKAKVIVIPERGATYDDVAAALKDATVEVRHRIKNRVAL